MDKHPKFAVVGHPNKGKSSIVSTLAQDEDIRISSIPGTTTKNRSFPLEVDGKILYELYDTPGFQRARAILAWLKKEETTADKRADRVAKFIFENEENPKFADDIQLLKPIVEGAGIVYVVDGSKPYGPEYEAEMEILRWSGSPSMALINFIGEDDYQEEWKKALNHYFKIVRVFNPMNASFGQILELMEGMAEIKYEWRTTIKDSIDALKLYQRQKIKNSAITISDTIFHALMHTKMLHGNLTQSQKDKLAQEFKREIEGFESGTYTKIASIWNHTKLERNIKKSSIINIDLFSKESSLIFGLDKKELVKNATIAGAITGSSFDLLLGGNSLFLGTTIGALIGGGGVLFGIDKLQNSELLKNELLKKTPFGSRKVSTIGPIRDLNFPFILLKRLIYFTKEIANRPHANRKKLSIDEDLLFSKEWVDDKTQNRLFKLHLNFSRLKKLQESKKEYEELIEMILLQYIEH
jgi:GTPase SAR1 family protein